MAIRDAYDGKREEMMKRIYPLFLLHTKVESLEGGIHTFFSLSILFGCFFLPAAVGRESERETQ